ncbi:MAG: hypothetical protein ACTHQ3_06525 [Motilibacteraceae bacterium]
MSTIEPTPSFHGSSSSPREPERHEQVARAHFMLAEVFEELGNLESSQRERALGQAHLEKSTGGH